MKKNGILHRISTAVLAGAMLLSLASCGASSSQTASSAAGKVTGTGSAKGIEGDVVVEVTADADTIYSIVVTEQNETQGIGSVACEQLPDAMVAANSYNVDGIAGATVTSDALKEAVKAALENAGLDASAFAVAKAADTTVEKTAETLDSDVVVVGAGGAGRTAAAQAAENGAKVIVVEKMPIVGGNSLKATGGMNAADTQYQADLGITDSGVQEFIEDTINGGHGINDRSLVTVMAEQSSDAIDWLTSIGAPLPKVAATGGTTHKYLHEPEDGSAVGSYLVEKLNAQAEKLGVQILLNTKATEILTNDGAACGIKAESTEHDYTINAKSVIIAAGGFGANFELMASFNPALANAVTTNHAGATGDGILTSLKMMEVMLAKKKPLSALAAPLKIYPQVLENVRVTDKKAAQDDAAVQAAVKAVAEALGDTGRILVRESGTEPVVRVMVEAPDHDTCQKYVSQVVDVIKAQGYSV